MADPENILLIRLKSIGDVVLTLPAVHAVRENFPGARLHFLVSTESAAMVRGFADVDEIISLDRAAYRSGHPVRVCSHFFKLVQRLREKRFSLVIDFQGYGETAWLSWLSGAPERWGRAGRLSRAWVYTRPIRPDNTIQIADWNLSVLEQCGLPVGTVRNEYALPPDALEAARQFFSANGLDPARPTIFIQPFTSSPRKNWGLENYLTVAKHWRSQGMQILFGGGPSERQALQPARDAGFVVAAGVPLLVAGGLMKMSSFVLGGITGLLHLAVAMQTRVVMLVGHPSREAGFPYQHRDWAVSSASDGPVSEVTLAAVIDATARAFADCGAAARGLNSPGQ
jgi:ADP-heptose:LPS heptosyltransferase